MAHNQNQTMDGTRKEGFLQKYPILKLVHWLLTAIILVIFIWRLGTVSLLQTINRLNIQVFMLLSLMQFLTLCACAWSLWLILVRFGSKIKFSQVFLIYLSSNFIENITPSLKFGGEAVKIYLLRKATDFNYQILTGALIIYKFLSMLSFLILFTLSILFFNHSFRKTLLPYGAGILLFLLLLLWLNRVILKKEPFWLFKKLPIMEKVFQFITEALQAIKENMNRKQIAMLFLIWFLIWLLYPIKLLIITHNLGLTLPFLPATAALYSSYLVSMLPITPGGLGTFEGSLIMLLSSLSITTQMAAGVVLTLRLFTYWLPLVVTGFTTMYFFIRDNIVFKPQTR